MDLKQLHNKYGIQYNTIKHIVQQFGSAGKVNAQKYKRKLIEKKIVKSHLPK